MKFVVLCDPQSKSSKIYFMILKNFAPPFLIFFLCFFSVARLQAQETKNNSINTIELRVGEPGNEPFVIPEKS